MFELRKKSQKIWTHKGGQILSKASFRIFLENNFEYIEYTEEGGMDAMRCLVSDLEVFDDTGAGTSIPFANGLALGLLLESLDAPFFNSASGGSGAGASNPFTISFTSGDWASQQYSVSASTHGKGNNPNFEIYDSNGDRVDVTSSNRTAIGDITLTVTSGSEFDGEITIN